MRTNIVLVAERDDLWFSGSLAFDGVTSRGDTKDEARKNIEIVLNDMAAHKEIELSNTEMDPDEFINSIYPTKQRYILSDVLIDESAIIDNPSVAVRTNVSIKRGYKLLAKMRKINMSDFINKALAKELGTEF